MQNLAAAAASGEYHLLLHGQHAYREQLVPAPRPRARPKQAVSQTVIVTGGTKGLGLEFAKHQLDKGASAAVLLSRDAAIATEQLADLASGGKAVFTLSCNAGDCKALKTVLMWAREWLPPVQASFQENFLLIFCKGSFSKASGRSLYEPWNFELLREKHMSQHILLLNVLVCHHQAINAL